MMTVTTLTDGGQQPVTIAQGLRDFLAAATTSLDIALYDFALGHHYGVVHRAHLLRSLTPLYLGRTASFVLETATSGSAEVEERIRRLADEFVAQKPHLRERWGG